MRKVYLFVHNEGVEAREKFVEIIKSIPEILAWRYDMTSCFYLISEHSAEIIADRIRKRTMVKGKLLVIEITNNYYGWLTDKTWHLFHYKNLKED